LYCILQLAEFPLQVGVSRSPENFSAPKSHLYKHEPLIPQDVIRPLAEPFLNSAREKKESAETA